MDLNNDTELPVGWKRYEKTRAKGATAGRVDVYVSSPNGHIFSSKKKLAEYAKERRLNLNLDQFDFKPSSSKSIATPTSTESSLTYPTEEEGSTDSQSFTNLETDSFCNLNYSKTEPKSSNSNEKPTDVDEKINSMDSYTTLSLSLLQGDWVTDEPIQIYFDLLVSGIDNNIHLMNPAISQAVKCLRETDSIVNPLNLGDKCFIFIPVSNSVAFDHDPESRDKVQIGYGSHWSLLLFVKEKNTFFHFDSIKALNDKPARLMAKNLSKYLNLNVQGEKVFIDCETPKQTNSVDCGVYLTLITERLLSNVIKKLPEETKLILPNFSELDIWLKRCFMSSILCNIRTNYQIMRRKVLQSLECSTISELERENTSKNETQENTKTDTSVNVSAAEVHFNVNHISTPTSQPRLTLVCDSQGNDVAHYINLGSSNDLHVFGNTFSGAPLHSLMSFLKNDKDIQRYTKKDWVVFIGGTVDVAEFYECKYITESIVSILKEQVEALQNTNLILSTIPYRYDLKNDCRQNDLIREINFHIRKLADSFINVYILDLYMLQKHHHTKQGFHIGRRGKIFVSNLICEIIKNSSVKNDNNLSDRQCLQKDVKSIAVEVANMNDIFNKYSSDEDTAFSHCISADLDNEKKNMSAGVAVPFRNRFGRPKQSDFCSDHLTFQQSQEGAAIYSLVTKPVYFSKPKHDVYDAAFEELTQQFKRKNYKKLVCSPMGCVRDRIPLRHFAKNIVKFQSETNSQVTIVTYKQASHKNLHDGLPFEIFVRDLRSAVYDEYQVLKSDFRNIELPHEQSPAVEESLSAESTVPDTDMGHTTPDETLTPASPHPSPSLTLTPTNSTPTSHAPLPQHSLN